MEHRVHLKEIERQALSFFKDYALNAYGFILLSQAAIAYFIYKDFESRWVIIWFLAIVFQQTISLFYRLNMPTSKLWHRNKLLKGTITNLLDSTILASSLLFCGFISVMTHIIITMVLIIYCTGAVPTTVGYQRFFHAFTVPIYTAVYISLIPLIYSTTGVPGLIGLTFAGVMIIVALNQISFQIRRNFIKLFSANLKLNIVNRELELAVKQAKKANESKTRFLASASHDLRQPINVISLFIANLTLKDTQGEYTDIISHMNSAIYSIDNQLESLLDISKLDAGVVNVKIEETNLASLIEGLVSSYPSSENVTISYSSELSDLTVMTDAALFERILNNLISNSVKYTLEGYIDVSIKCRNNRALIRIKDTGIGIKSRELDNIFDEFYQIDNVERSSENGLGLGLSIVKRLSDLLDINLTLTSEYGLGTIVNMDMAYKKATVRNEFNFDIEKSSFNIDSESKRIIVLDNEKSIIQALKSVLESMEHEVDVFTSSNHALRHFENKRFDIALIDYRLSKGILGSDVIKRMREINKRTKFFLVTGDIKVEESSIYKIVHKPVTDKKLEYIFNE